MSVIKCNLRGVYEETVDDEHYKSVIWEEGVRGNLGFPPTWDIGSYHMYFLLQYKPAFSRDQLAT